MSAHRAYSAPTRTGGHIGPPLHIVTRLALIQRTLRPSVPTAGYSYRFDTAGYSSCFDTKDYSYRFDTTLVRVVESRLYIVEEEAL